jgi:hypothetical protein
MDNYSRVVNISQAQEHHVFYKAVRRFCANMITWNEQWQCEQALMHIQGYTIYVATSFYFVFFLP